MGKALRLLLFAASGACSMRRSFTPLYGGLCYWHDLFQTCRERLPAFTALGFRERTVNPGTPQPRVGQLARARAAGSVG